MDAKTAAEILENHQLWRRGGDGPQTVPVSLGKALDVAIAVLKAPVYQMRSKLGGSWIGTGFVLVTQRIWTIAVLYSTTRPD